MPSKSKKQSAEVYIAELTFKEIYLYADAMRFIDKPDGSLGLNRAFMPFEVDSLAREFFEKMEKDHEVDIEEVISEDMIAEFNEKVDIESAIKAGWKKKPEEEKALYRCFRVAFESRAALTAFVNKFSEADEVLLLQEEPKMELFASPNPVTQWSGAQWGLTKINASAAWGCAMGDEVLVSVVDSGLDVSHWDIEPNLWQEFYVSWWPFSFGIIHGWNFTGVNSVTDIRDISTGQIQDKPSHGTHVAGIIAGRGQNGLGMAGVAPRARLLGIKAYINGGGQFGPGYWTPNYAGSTYAPANGIAWSRFKGADVINCSWGSTINTGINPYSANYLAITYAVSLGSTATRPSIIVFSAGNTGGDTSNCHPQNDPRVITVAATDPSDNLSSFSSFGSHVDVCAPGESVFSTLSKDDPASPYPNPYGTKSGTSMAAPHVSGMVALILQKHPNLDFDRVKRIVRAYVAPVNSQRPHGTGRIDFTNLPEILCGCGCGPCALDTILLERELMNSASIKTNIVPSMDTNPNSLPGSICEPIRLGQLTPQFYLHWGDGPNDQLETEDEEVLYITACNPYENVGFSGLKILKIEISPNQVTPNGALSVELTPSELICYDELEPCTCATREYGLFNRQASVGLHNFRFYYCIENINVLNQNRGEDVFVLDYVQS